MSQKRQRHGGDRGASRGVRAGQVHYTDRGRSSEGKRLPLNWRDRLPEGAAYYRGHVDHLGAPNGEGWAQGRCPFHDDRHESLSVNLLRGGWRCFAGCGKGDLVRFHQRLTGQDFKAAVRDLVGVRA